MVIREIVTRIINEQTGELLKEVSNFENGLLYGVYAVVSNKTVRTKEKLLIRWYNKKADIPGKEMVKTNRGWFIDGYQVDDRSVNDWFRLTGNTKNPKPKKWNSSRKHVKKS